MTILPATEGTAIQLQLGYILEISNTFGSQVLDTWGIRQDEPLEYSSMEHTRSVNSNIYLDQGMTVVSNKRRPLFSLVEDTTPGRHDTLLCPCSAEIYKELGCVGYHRSCTDNFHEAVGRLGLGLPFTPASLNLFMNVPVDETGAVRRVPPASRAGDRVVLRAEADIILVLSSCPQDVTPINGAERTPRDVSYVVRAGPS